MCVCLGHVSPLQDKKASLLKMLHSPATKYYPSYFTSEATTSQLEHKESIESLHLKCG